MSAFQLPEQHRLPFVASDSSLLQAGEHYFFTFLPLLHRLYVTFHAEFIENNTYKLFWVHSSCPRTYGLAFVKGSRCCSKRVSITFSLFDYFFSFYMLLFMLILLKLVRRTYWECISVPRRPSVAIWQAPFWPLVSFSTSTTPTSSMAASAGELPSYSNNFANKNHPILFRRKFLYFAGRTRMLSWASLRLSRSVRRMEAESSSVGFSSFVVLSSQFIHCVPKWVRLPWSRNRTLHSYPAIVS